MQMKKYIIQSLLRQFCLTEIDCEKKTTEIIAIRPKYIQVKNMKDDLERLQEKAAKEKENEKKHELTL